MGLGQVETPVVSDFIPGETDINIISARDTAPLTVAVHTNRLYEAALLAISFIFLLLGLLPARPGTDVRTLGHKPH